MRFSFFEERNLEKTFLFLACIPSFIIVLIWHLLNKEYPMNDAANFWLVSLDIYHHLTTNGFLKFPDIYDMRDWRPIIFPHFNSIFLFLSGGNSLFMAAASHLTFNLLLCIWAFLLMRIYVDRVFAVIVVIICSLLPIHLKWGMWLYADVAFFSLGVGSVYHLIKSEFFQNKTHSILFAVIFALTICMRPVVAFTVFIIPLVFYFFQFIRRNTDFLYYVKKIVLMVVASALVFVVCFAADFYQDSRVFKYFLRIFLSLIAIASIFKFWIKDEEKNYFLKSFFLLLFLITFWWSGFTKELYLWTFDCTFGNVASFSDRDHQKGFFTIISFYLRDLGYAQIIIPLLCILFSLLFLALRRKDIKDVVTNLYLKVKNDAFFLFSFLSFIFLIFISIKIIGFDARRGMLSYILLLFGIFILLYDILKESKFCYRLSIGFLSIFILLQFLLTLDRISETNYRKNYLINDNKLSFANYLLPSVEVIPLPKKDSPTQITMNWLWDNFFVNNLQCVEKSNRPCGVVSVTDFPFQTFNPFTIITLNGAVLRNSRTLFFESVPPVHHFKQYMDSIRDHKNKYYLLLEMDFPYKKHNIMDKGKTDIYTKLNYRLVNFYIEGKLDKFGLYEVNPQKPLIINNRKLVLLTFK